MLGKLISFELKLHFNQIGFWITAAILFLFAVLTASTDFIVVGTSGGEKIKINGALIVASQIGFFSFLPILFGSVFVVTGMMRDDTSKSLEIIHATPVSTFDMVCARMIGVFCATFGVVMAAVAGLFAGQFAPWIDAEKLGAINPAFYIYPALMFTVVNSLFVTALFTAIAGVTRNRMLVYTSAVGLLIIYFSVQIFLGEDLPDLPMALSDPFGLSALAVITEFWPADEQNNRLVPLMGYLGLNRLTWLGAGLVILAGMFRFFPRGVIGGKSGRAAAAADLRAGFAPVILTKPLSEGVIAAAWSRLKLEYVAAVKSIAFVILLSLATALFGLSIYAQTEFVPEPLLPTNVQMAQTALGSAALPLLIMIVFFSGEIFWRDKTYKVLELVDSTRVSNVSLLIGKWSALAGVVLTILGAAMLVGIIAQLMIGGVPVDLWTHVQLAFVDFAPGFLLMGGLAMFIQNFAPNRIVGMLAAAGTLIVFFFFLGQLPFDHPLLRFGNLPNGGFSEMNGFGDTRTFAWHGLYWGSLTILFAVISAWLWRRGVKPSFRRRLQGQGGRLGLVTACVGALAVAGFAGAGSVLYKGYSVDNTFRNTKQTEKFQANLEKAIGARIKDPVPKVRDVTVAVDMFPETQSARFAGSFRLENTTGAPLTEMFISLPGNKPGAVANLTIKGAAEVTEGEIYELVKNEDLRLYRFTPAMAAGAFTTLTFDVTTLAPTLGSDSPIRRNGTFVNHTQVLPTIGLQDFRLENKDKRRKLGLPVRERLPERDNAKARQNNFFDRGSDYVTFKASFCTAPGQTPIAPGEMIRAYEKDGRACRDYQPNEPIANFFAFVSADYAVKEETWSGPNGERIPLAIYYHAPHAFNVDLMLGAMKSSLTTYTRAFGPYQYTDIRIMEFPYASFAQSFAGTIPFSENIGFMRDPGDPADPKRIDLATYITMHEIGHQWFGHQIVPAETKGFNVLSEGITEHAAMVAYEEVFGWTKARRLVEKQAMEAYLTSRTFDTEDEPPLALAEGQQYLDYNKAAWVFWGLRQTMGAEKVNAALRRFLGDYGRKGPPYPTSLELVAALRAEAGPEWQQMITDYWDRIALWELLLAPEGVTVAEVEGGWTATVAFTVDKKIAAEETGKETSVSETGEALNEWVEIGFYDTDPKETLGADWIKLERVRVTTRDGKAQVALPRKPTHVVLDPRRYLIERNVKDNVAEVE
jgi:ABC-2 type transport system permease protein